MPNDIREMREAAVKKAPNLVPCGGARLQPFPSRLKVRNTERNGQQYKELDGYASTTERGYEMWDMFGPYTEIVSAGAFDKTLAANPDVAFLVNHRGVTMARTVNGSLELSADETGLRSLAYLNPKRQDVRDLILAIDDGDITEMSFAFMITDGQWSPDYTEYRINEVDLDRGDVSAVNYGANPYTSIAARSHEILETLERLPTGAARAAIERLQHRNDLEIQVESEISDATPTNASDKTAPEAERMDEKPTKQGRSTLLIAQLLLAEEEDEN